MSAAVLFVTRPDERPFRALFALGTRTQGDAALALDCRRLPRYGKESRR
jgi:hypothetical protein